MCPDPQKYKRRSIRLPGYDYSRVGGYFITIVTRNHECLFGDIANGEMRLSEFGQIVRDEWLKNAQIRQEIELDQFVIMPNHLHGIIFISDIVGADGRPPVNEPSEMECSNVENNRAHSRVPLQRKPKTIGSLVAGFKSAATKRINKCRNRPGKPLWQRNYYERIIRDEDELDRIREYISNNPLKWELDKENPTVWAKHAVINTRRAR